MDDIKSNQMKDCWSTYFNKPRMNALNLTSPSVTASSLLILNTSSFKDFVIGPEKSKSYYFSCRYTSYTWRLDLYCRYNIHCY